MLIFFLYWEAQNWTQYSRYNLTSAKNGKDDFTGPAGYIFTNPFHNTVGIFSETWI